MSDTATRLQKIALFRSLALLQEYKRCLYQGKQHDLVKESEVLIQLCQSAITMGLRKKTAQRCQMFLGEYQSVTQCTNHFVKYAELRLNLKLNNI